MTRLSLALMSLLYVSTAVWHLRSERFFLSVTPPWVPWPRAVNRFVAAFEACLALGLCFEVTRRAALLGIIALLVAVFPVHVHMLRDAKASQGLPRWILWGRLPLQAVLITWAWAHL